MAGFVGDEYELVAQVASHDGDVRSLCALGNDGLVSGSRDALAKVWRLNDRQTGLECEKTLYHHEHWVSALVALPDGGFATGSQDKKIRWYDGQGNLLGTGVGHQGPVTSLAWDSSACKLLSGSWDSTARIWNLDSAAKEISCCGQLGGHENGCCVLALPNGDIITGSAGMQVNNRVEGFQLRVWRGGQCIKSMKDHQSAVRALCLSSPDGSTFASCGNDGTVRVWSSSSYDMLHCVVNPPGPEGQPAFNYSIAALSNYTELVSASDDHCARVWDLDSGSIKQEVLHPGTVWCVAQLANGDLVTGSSDGFIRVFTREDARKAPKEVREAFVETACKAREAAAAKMSNGGKKIDPSSLTKIYDAQPGESDGQIKMFNKDGIAYVYQWSGDSGTWVEVGEVMGDAGGEELDGKLYDKVVPVELEDRGTGGVRKLKLGFNNGDNPFVVAQDFVNKHGLDEMHVNEIAQFVQNVRGQSASQPVIDMSGGAGGGGAQFNDPMDLSEDSNAAAPSNLPFPLPMVTGLAFDSVDLSKVWAKLVEFNASEAVQNGGNALSPSELGAVEQVVETLQAKSRYHASSVNRNGVQALCKKGIKWDIEHVFPVLDLMRVLLTHPDGAQRVVDLSGGQLLPTALELATQGNKGAALCGAKFAANFFRHRPAALAATQVLKDPSAEEGVSTKLNDLATFPNKNVRAAAATAALNCANALSHAQFNGENVEIVCAGLLASAIQMAQASLSEPKEQETVRRCLLAMGCLASLGGLSAPEVDAICKLTEQVGPGPAKSVAEQVQGVLKTHK